MGDMANPKIGHFFMGRIVCPPHFKNNLFDKFQHPLYEPIRLRVDVVWQPYIILLVAGHHDHNFFLYYFPHPSSELNNNSL